MVESKYNTRLLQMSFKYFSSRATQWRVAQYLKAALKIDFNALFIHDIKV